MSEFLNKSHKYVVSRSLDTLEWGPASLVTGDLAEELNKLKQLPGKNIQIPGSATLVRSLLRDGLIDELVLNVCPIVVGPGLRLFEGITDPVPLKVAQSEILNPGVINVTYEPGSADQAAPESSVVTFPDAEVVSPRTRWSSGTPGPSTASCGRRCTSSYRPLSPRSRSRAGK